MPITGFALVDTAVRWIGWSNPILGGGIAVIPFISFYGMYADNNDKTPFIRDEEERHKLAEQELAFTDKLPENPIVPVVDPRSSDGSFRNSVLTISALSTLITVSHTAISSMQEQVKNPVPVNQFEYNTSSLITRNLMMMWGILCVIFILIAGSRQIYRRNL